ncbi:MAG TPA: hypothetical protein VIB39_06475 [Candidatus Angelobacter sp.]
MRYLKYLALLVAVLALASVHSQAQVAIGVQIGPSYGIYNPPPVCEYGFYPYYPYACAPYGYWAPSYFVNGVFIGVGPWRNFYYTHPTYYRPYYVNRFGFRPGFEHFRPVERFGPRETFRGERFDHDRGFRNFNGPRFDRDRGFDRGRGYNEARGFRGDNRGFRGGDHGYRGMSGRGPEGRGGSHNGGGNYRGGGESHGGNHGGRR